MTEVEERAFIDKATRSIEQTTGQRRIIVLIGFVFVPRIAGKVGREHGISGRTGTAQHHPRDTLPIDGMGDGAADADVVERRQLVLEIEIGRRGIGELDEFLVQ